MTELGPVQLVTGLEIHGGVLIRTNVMLCHSQRPIYSLSF